MHHVPLNFSMELITWRKEGDKDEHALWNMLWHDTASPQPTKVPEIGFPKEAKSPLILIEGHHINKTGI